MSIPERFDVRSLIVVGTQDFVNARPTWFDSGFRLQAAGDGNFEYNLLASDMDNSVPGNFFDITSLVSGGATIVGNRFVFVDRIFGTVRVNVTSIQSTKHLNLSGSWI